MRFPKSLVVKTDTIRSHLEHWNREWEWKSISFPFIDLFGLFFRIGIGIKQKLLL